MLRFFSALLELVLPIKRRIAHIKTLELADIPVAPRREVLHDIEIQTLLDYRNPIVEDLIRSLKFDDSMHAATLLSKTLADYLYDEVSDIRSFSALPIVLIPVPLHRSRLRTRGFNQIEAVLKCLPEEFTNGTLATADPRLLTRSRATPPQTHLSRDERIKNVAGAFSCTRNDFAPAHFVVIDDVATTGATLFHATAPLRTERSKVHALAFARA